MTEPVFWFRIPDDEQMLASMKPAELRCYLVILRDIQRARNAGRLSMRQISDRAGVSLTHAHAAVETLISRDLVQCEKRPGSIATYSVRFSWHSRNRSPVGEQLDEPDCIPVGEQLATEAPPKILEKQPPISKIEPVAAGSGEQLGEQYCSPVGERNCSPVGERNCSPVGEQHLESSDYSDDEIKDQHHDDSATVRKNREQPAEFVGRKPAPSVQTPNPQNELKPVKSAAVPVQQKLAALPPIEHVKRLQTEMASIKGQQPSAQMVDDVCKVLESRNRSILGFALHLANIDARYRPGGHKAIKFWSFFIAVAEAYCDTPEPDLPGHMMPGLIMNDCRHGLEHGDCPQCLTPDKIDAMTEALG